MKDISKKEYLDAVSLGVKQAILTMCEAGDGFDGEIIREPFLNSIREGVEQGIYIAMPDMSYLKDDLIDSFKNSINIWKINERG